MTREPLRTVFFLSDYGTEDEFAGVVHAVIAAQAPGTTVIDLTHHIPPFDVRAGSHALVRAVPYLGPGVVLAVVDPGVGTGRRGIGLEVALPSGASLAFVGPDNGLLVAAAEAAAEAPVARAVELARPPAPPDRGSTFDGRDLFAPAAAALCSGVALEELGAAIDQASLVRLIGGVVEEGRLHDGRCCLRSEVTWVDRFGNLQLAATVADARVAGMPSTGSVELAARLESGSGRGGEDPDGLPRSLVPDGMQLRCVDAFGELEQGEFGLLVDANGHLAVVAGEASAARWLNVAAGELLVLAW
jgi:S-adenosyl-L-methionine hydrolase (adenosine-forming)